MSTAGVLGGLAATVPSEVSAVEPPTVYTDNDLMVDEDWTTIDNGGWGDSSWEEEVVVTGPPTFEGTQQGHWRVRDVINTDFEVKLEEWDYLDGNHAYEALNYAVVPGMGGWEEDDSDTRVGTSRESNVDDNWHTHELMFQWYEKPVVVHQVVTENGGDSVVSRTRNLREGADTGEYKLDVTLEEQESKGSHTGETVHFLAATPGTGTLTGRKFEAGRVTGVDENWTTISFQQNYNQPTFLASIETHNGGDTCALRQRNLSSNNVEVFVEEEQSADDETGHVGETVGYMVVEGQPCDADFAIRPVVYDGLPYEHKQRTYNAVDSLAGQIKDQYKKPLVLDVYQTSLNPDDFSDECSYFQAVVEDLHQAPGVALGDEDMILVGHNKFVEDLDPWGFGQNCKHKVAGNVAYGGVQYVGTSVNDAIARNMGIHELGHGYPFELDHRHGQIETNSNGKVTTVSPMATAYVKDSSGSSDTAMCGSVGAGAESAPDNFCDGTSNKIWDGFDCPVHDDTISNCYQDAISYHSGNFCDRCG